MRFHTPSHIRLGLQQGPQLGGQMRHLDDSMRATRLLSLVLQCAKLRSAQT